MWGEPVVWGLIILALYGIFALFNYVKEQLFPDVEKRERERKKAHDELIALSKLPSHVLNDSLSMPGDNIHRRQVAIEARQKINSIRRQSGRQRP